MERERLEHQKIKKRQKEAGNSEGEIIFFSDRLEEEVLDEDEGVSRSDDREREYT